MCSTCVSISKSVNVYFDYMCKHIHLHLVVKDFQRKEWFRSPNQSSSPALLVACKHTFDCYLGFFIKYNFWALFHPTRLLPHLIPLLIFPPSWRFSLQFDSLEVANYTFSTIFCLISGIFSEGRSGDLARVNRVGELRFFGMEFSSKRARAPNIGAQCLVDGCNSDLSKCRDYHRRHKVCEVHSKTPKVTIGGQEQRFCQQCSRFHSLVEFDEGKRSCRKRLDGHNRRRRKPQPESLSFNSSRFLSTQQGTRFMPFSNPQIFPTTAVGSSGWDSTIKAQNDPMHYNTHPQLNFIDRKTGSLPHSYGGGKQFPFLQGSADESSVCQPLPNHVSMVKIEGSGRKLFSDGSNRVINNNNSDRALSLLSSPPAETLEIGLSHIMQPTPPAQTLFLRSQYNNASGMEEDGVPIGSVMAAESSNMYCQGMFQIEADHESSANANANANANASHHTISFSWE